MKDKGYQGATWPPRHSEEHRIKAGQTWKSISGLICAKVVMHNPDLDQLLAYVELGGLVDPYTRDRILGVQVVWPAHAPRQSVVHEIEEFLGRYRLVED